jgi:hypothetical protein
LEETGKIIPRRNKYVFFILVMTGIHKMNNKHAHPQEKARKACAKRAFRVSYGHPESDFFI